MSRVEIEGVEEVISKGYEARVVHVACTSEKDEVMVSVIGTAVGTISREGGGPLWVWQLKWR